MGKLILFTIILYVVFFIRDIKAKILWKKRLKKTEITRRQNETNQT